MKFKGTFGVIIKVGSQYQLDMFRTDGKDIIREQDIKIGNQA